MAKTQKKIRRELTVNNIKYVVEAWIGAGGKPRCSIFEETDVGTDVYNQVSDISIMPARVKTAKSRAVRAAIDTHNVIPFF